MIDSLELRSRIAQGLKKDNTPYIQELGGLLDAYTINTGAKLTLGGNADTAQRVSDLLGIDESLQDGTNNVLSVAIENSNIRSDKGSLRPFVAESGVIPALSYIQASQWQFQRFPRLWSRVSVGVPREHAEPMHDGDSNRPLLSLSAMAIYTAGQQERFMKLFHETLPTYGQPEATRYTPTHEAEVPAKALKRYIESLDDPSKAPIVPIKKYWMEIGPATEGIHTQVVFARSHFVLKGDHFVPEKSV